MARMRGPSAHTEAPFSVYLAAVVVIFFLSLSAADSVGLVPCAIDGTCTVENTLTQNPLQPDLLSLFGSATSSAVRGTALPTRIKIDAISLDLPVQNPDTIDIGVLDTLLQKGPARYVDSAQLGEAGTMIIFAHSSHLPIVHNQMYKAFNNIPNLVTGDAISLEGKDGKSYLYSVTTVRKATASEDEKIYLKSDIAHLTLVTCDTLTGKSARYIVEATLIGTE